MKKFILILLYATSLAAHAGYEIVCKNFQPRQNTDVKVTINCKNVEAIKSALRKGDADLRNYFSKQANMPMQNRSYQVRDDERMECLRAINDLDSPGFQYPGMNWESIAESILARCNSPLSRIN